MLELEKINIRSEKDDEIDLIELLTKAILFLKQYVGLLIIFTIIGILIGILLYTRTPFYYKSRMIVNSTALSNPEAINIINSWQVHITKNDYEILARKLNLSYETAYKIKNFKANETVPAENKRFLPPEAEDGSFTIEASVSDVQVLDSLEMAIINFLEDNKYIKIRSALKKANLQRLKIKIDNEIASLDSLKHSLNNILNNNRYPSGAFLTNPAEVNVKIIELYERSLNIETSIKLVDDVQVVESFTKSNTPDGPDLIKFPAIGGAIGLFLAFVIVFVLYLRNKIRTIS
ncbi:hypothetical protein GXP67_20255 [Rhodocytophaga rosea]|uniref:Polysaccharide chain length determinant N-terminal domain-containing protein n=1 Tax=Rhodocytophaga rosea TaxID=2704465 RepID=A0A6C0GLX9_9BACT|nr:hypothetical protein [Rhodocytophaga rosea]QHT68814.1 hypothetical protein GXP67_20255 [Rhodocytophaga rosea]